MKKWNAFEIMADILEQIEMEDEIDAIFGTGDKTRRTVWQRSERSSFRIAGLMLAMEEFKEKWRQTAKTVVRLTGSTPGARCQANVHWAKTTNWKIFIAPGRNVLAV